MLLFFSVAAGYYRLVAIKMVVERALNGNEKEAPCGQTRHKSIP